MEVGNERWVDEAEPTIEAVGRVYTPSDPVPSLSL